METIQRKPPVQRLNGDLGPERLHAEPRERLQIKESSLRVWLVYEAQNPSRKISGRRVIFPEPIVP
jgi:hypothetical protein